MNTLSITDEQHIELPAEQTGMSRTTKLVLAGLISLGILDGYQDYAKYSQEKTPVAEVQRK